MHDKFQSQVNRYAMGMESLLVESQEEPDSSYGYLLIAEINEGSCTAATTATGLNVTLASRVPL